MSVTTDITYINDKIIKIRKLTNTHDMKMMEGMDFPEILWYFDRVHFVSE